MIDEKKIEEAAFEKYPLNSDGNIIGRNGFKEGVKWAVNESLKDLWHPASVEPKCHSYIIFKTTNNNGFGTEYIDCSWEILVRCLQITQWLYAEDLLPKEGGECQ